MAIELSSINRINMFTSSVNTATINAASSERPFSAALRNALGDGISTSGSADLDIIFAAAGERYNLPPNLLKAVAQVESNFRPLAVSRAGAQGIMQLMPGTARHLGVDDPFDPEQNIMGGARYLRELLDRFDGDLTLALASYNAGWPTVMRYGGIPPFAETQAYVPRVLELFNGGDISVGTVSWGNSDAQGSQAAQGSHGAQGSQGASSSGGSAAAANNNNSNNNDATTAMLDMMNQMVMMRMMEMQMGTGRGNDSRSRGLF